jgi:hypothetical protein
MPNKRASKAFMPRGFAEWDYADHAMLESRAPIFSIQQLRRLSICVDYMIG